MDQLTWSLLPLPTGTFRYVFAKTPGGVVGTWVPGPRALEAFARNHAGWDVYIQLNPARTRGLVRPTAADVACIQAILVDFDPIYLPDDLVPLPFADPDATVVDSGRGVQHWIRFDPPAPVEWAPRVEGFLRSLAHPSGWRIDMTYDLPRLARLPGTVNSRTGRVARVLVEGSPRAPEWLLQWEALERPTVRTPRGLTRLGDVWPDLTWAARNFLTVGAVEGERHKACVAAARSLREAGAGDDAALGWLVQGGERCDPPLDEGEVEKIWSKQR